MSNAELVVLVSNNKYLKGFHKTMQRCLQCEKGYINFCNGIAMCDMCGFSGIVRKLELYEEVGRE